jgi:hypothetical protein
MIGVALFLVFGALVWLGFVPRVERERWVLRVLTGLLSTCPPTDEVVRQLPPERFASVEARGEALVARMLTPAIAGAAGLLCASVLAYALVARKLRPIFDALVARAPVRSRRLGLPIPVFAILTLITIAVHVPYLFKSIRYDEDSASVLASNGAFCWANNLTFWGWGVHVAATFSIRLTTALFGLSELTVRAPATLASSVGLALLCSYLWSRISPWLGAATAGLVIALPMWVEQTSLARGYGLSFAAASLLVVALLQLYEESDSPSSATMACLFFGVFVGALAHVFFVCLVVGVFAVLCVSGRFSREVRSALLWWVVLASILPALSFLAGAPASIALSQSAGHPGFGVALERTMVELSFRHAGMVGYAIAIMTVSVLILASLTFPKIVRYRLWLVLAATFLPALLNPVYLYPRYFLHAIAFLAPVAAWFLSIRVLRAKPLPNLALLALIAGLWLSGDPLHPPTFVDLRTGAQLARSEAERYGTRFAVDSFLSNGIRFYNGPTNRLVNTWYPVPADIDRILLGVPHGFEASRIPPGFVAQRRLPGTENDLWLLARTATKP